MISKEFNPGLSHPNYLTRKRLQHFGGKYRIKMFVFKRNAFAIVKNIDLFIDVRMAWIFIIEADVLIY